jgi:diguanylate cyclase (GGDEF)-like protein
MARRIRAYVVGSFRNRLLALIIGLVVVTQTVTLIAVLARTSRDVQARAAGELRSGGSVVQQYIRARGSQLTSAVDLLAADYGFRSAVASREPDTMLSAAQNHSERIGADLVLLLDTNGRVLASAPRGAWGHDAASLRELPDESASARQQDHFIVLGHNAYQLFLAPVRAPETIGWVAMGFAVDDALAHRIRELVGVNVSLVTYGREGTSLAASTLPAAERTALARRQQRGTAVDAPPTIEQLGSHQYLTFVSGLDGSRDSIELVLQKPMTEVLAPYQDLRNALLAIGGIALALAAAVGWRLGRSATSPIGELVKAARRIQAGTYDVAVQTSGGEEFRSLAATFNAMQSGIAEREARITHDAYHDSLTQLPNRAFAERHLDELLASALQTTIAVIVIDVRNVREINASLGHHVGDDALREVARRLRQNIAPADLVARLAANQFLIVARDCSLERAPLLAEQLAGVIRSGFHLPNVSLELHVTAGVCSSPEHGSSTSELLRRVQIALGDAEDARGRMAIYRPERDEEHRRRLALVADLRRAIENDELTLVYQPKVAVSTRSVRSFEALVRWSHPRLGAVSPGEFVPLAEQTGGSRRLTSWVLSAAIRQMAAWRREGLDVDVAVNLSAPDILDPAICDEILSYLRTHGIEPARLVLEITESAMMRDAQLAARNMQLLRIAGVRFAIDDFGTGYSSLSQLSGLPLDELKIDRSFIAQAHERRDHATIVMSTIELAHSMGLKVVAEGVETAEGWNLLRRLGCDFAQGYLISRPLAVPDVVPFVRQANQLLAASDSTVRQIRALEELSTRRGS